MVLVRPSVLEGKASDRQSALLSPVVRSEGTLVVVALRGEADISTLPILGDVVSQVIAVGIGDVIVDLSETTFIDSASIRVLATGQRTLEQAGRKLTFRLPSRVAARVLDLYGLAHLIDNRGSSGSHGS